MQFSTFLFRTAPPLCAALLLASCAAPADQDAEQAADANADNPAASEPAAEGDIPTKAEADAAPSQMPTMTQTAWRVRGEDGAIYTSYLDADGSYRDFKNGDPLQTGTWEERMDGKLCFTPEVEGRIGECWALAPLDSDNTMQPVSDAGKSIDLRQVTYLPPEDEG